MGIGCILGEMVAGKPLFRGQNAKEQLKLILSVLGKPLEEDVEFVQRESYKKVLKAMRTQTAKPWALVLPKASEQCVDMMEKMLCFNPAKRITVEEALHHPLLSGLPYDEKKANSTTEFPFVTES